VNAFRDQRRTLEGNSMGPNARRRCVLGFAVAASAAVAFSGSAAADQTLSGDCATTLRGARSPRLILDLGAPLNAPGKLTVGLDSQDSGLLSLPVGDVVRTLGVGELPAINGVCTTVQGTVNTVGDTTQGLLGGKPVTPTPPQKPGNSDSKPTGPGAPLAPNPGHQTGPGLVGGIGLPGADASSGISINTTLTPGGLGTPVIIPIVPPDQASSVGEIGVPPVVIADRSGTAQALPASNTPPARLPLLLAVLALTLVATVLVRTWLRRKPIQNGQ
jgi:hypothetical protein